MEDFDAMWASLEQRRKSLTDRILAMPPEQQRAGTSKSFSPAEVLDHMALSEAWYLPMMDKADRQTLKAKGAKVNFLYGMVVRKLRSAKSVPSMRDMTPKADVKPEDGAEHWEKVRNDLRLRISAVGLDEPVFRHPLFGRMSPRHVMEIFDAHTD
ncbi:MAG TPA: DinB family protein, partial [Fimbriimonadaceae bacterium]|nr:DinB family protein [Fimbriimonadaceae bacterium]